MRRFYCFIATPDFSHRLPEVPSDTADTNTLMNVNAEPEWSKVTPSSVYRACGKLAILYETELSKHLNELKGIQSYIILQ